MVAGMGCENSRSVNVEDNKKALRAGPLAEERIALTDLQVDVIRSTWPIFTKDIAANGVRVLLEMFTFEPEIKEVFKSFRNQSIESLQGDPLLLLHGRRFMETIQLAAEHIEDQETDHSEDSNFVHPPGFIHHNFYNGTDAADNSVYLNTPPPHPTLAQDDSKFLQCFDVNRARRLSRKASRTEVLMMLGAKHATLPGFELSYLALVTKCLHRTWEQVLGEEYTDDVREAWSAVFDYITSKLRDGYLIYMEDKENEKREKAAAATGGTTITAIGES